MGCVLQPPVSWLPLHAKGGEDTQGCHQEVAFHPRWENRVLIASLFRRLLPFKEIGYIEQGEEFTRWTLLKTPWFSLYLHRLKCPVDLHFCHDHPWRFWAWLLIGGYYEQLNGAPVCFRPAGSMLYRTEKDMHNVWTERRANWSLMLATKKLREWGFQDCRDPLTYRKF